PAEPGQGGSPGASARPGRPRWPEPDPVRPFTPDLAGDQPRTLHTRQQLRERHARTRVADGRGQLSAGHPVGVVELARFRQVRDDTLPRPHGPFSHTLMSHPHVSPLSPTVAITPADDLMIVLRPVSSRDSVSPAASSR